MSRSLEQAVFELMLSLPKVEQGRSSGAPVFKVAGKTFAYWVINHHDDGRVALWLACSPDRQQELIAGDSNLFFIPPYLGVKGWIGLDLTHNPRWALVTEQVIGAWTRVAPSDLADSVALKPAVEGPDRALTAEEINPMLGKRAQEVLSGLAERCDQLPGATAENRLETATWRVGNKVFVRGDIDDGRLQLMFRVGGEQQALMLDDPRYSLPAYYHANGWIALDVQDQVVWQEIEALLDLSYRHFALQRHLKLLDGEKRQ